MSHRTLAGFLLAILSLSTPVLAQQTQFLATPQAPVPLPPGNVERGRYVAEHVAMCVECHSGRDTAGNIIESQKYLGASLPIQPPVWARDWATHAPRNKGLPGYTDFMALRLLTQGAIGRRGEQLRAPMPRFRMSVQDAADVIAFLRSGS